MRLQLSTWGARGRRASSDWETLAMTAVVHGLKHRSTGNCQRLQRSFKWQMQFVRRSGRWAGGGRGLL